MIKIKTKGIKESIFKLSIV